MQDYLLQVKQTLLRKNIWNEISSCFVLRVFVVAQQLEPFTLSGVYVSASTPRDVRGEMAMAMNLGSSGNRGAEINVTPLIDVLLVLLIIFMVLTPLHNMGEKAVIPQPPQRDLPEIVQPSVIVLQMASDPRGVPVLRINGQDTNWTDLRPNLETIYKQRSDKAMFVRADETLDWDPVAQVIDIAHTAGVVNVGLITARIEEAKK